jgi:hypothetical protein
MLDLAQLVLIWDLLYLVSAVRRRRRDDVLIQTMIVDGAVVRFVVMCSLVENILAREAAMKGYVEAARS